MKLDSWAEAIVTGKLAMGLKSRSGVWPDRRLAVLRAAMVKTLKKREDMGEVRCDIIGVCDILETSTFGELG